MILILALLQALGFIWKKVDAIYDELYKALKLDFLPHHKASLKDALFLLRCYDATTPSQCMRKTLLWFEYQHVFHQAAFIKKGLQLPLVINLMTGSKREWNS